VRQAVEMRNAVRICIHYKYLAPLTKQMHEVPAVSASGVQHRHIGGNVSAQNLIENINVDLPKLLLHV